jgi:hypothetical protein
LISGVTLAAALVSGAVSLWLGQDLNFDLLNYHYYVGYAFLHGRLDQDIVPAGIQTYQSPLLHLFHYLGIAHLPPRLFGFLLAALQGLNVPLLFALGWSLLRGLETAGAVSVALLGGLLGAIGPNALSMLGTTFGDNLVTLPALLALLLVVELDRLPARFRRPALLVAGVLSGVATGLKLTMGVFQLALLLVAAVAPGTHRRRLEAVALLVAGSLLGFLPTGGFWAWVLYQRFGNPVFPLANGLFRSELFSPENFGSQIYVTRTLGDLLRPVVGTALGRQERLQEIPLRDLRLAVLLAAAALWLVVQLARRLRATGGAGARWLGWPATGLALYWVAGYLLWAAFFPYYRYFTLLELTAPLLAFALLRHVVAPRFLPHVALAVALALALTTRTGSWGRRPWSATWLQMPVPALGLRPDSMVLLVGQPISYVVPSFRRDARFVHLTAVDRFGAPDRWRERITRAVADHRGPLLLLSNFEFSWDTAAARAAELGLRVTPRCAPIRNGPLRLRLCELERSVPPGPAAPAP